MTQPKGEEKKDPKEEEKEKYAYDLKPILRALQGVLEKNGMRGTLTLQPGDADQVNPLREAARDVSAEHHNIDIDIKDVR